MVGHHTLLRTINKMRRELLIQSGKLEIISKLLGKSKNALKMYLWRKGKKIDDLEFIKEIILKLKD